MNPFSITCGPKSRRVKKSSQILHLCVKYNSDVVTPFKSVEMAQYMKNQVLGMDVPDEMLERMKGVPIQA